MKLVLDTNAYRAFVDAEPRTVDLVRSADVLALPVPVLAELRYGFRNGTHGLKNEAVLSRFVDARRVLVLDCDEQTSHVFADLKLHLKKRGTPIPINDVWIAALVIQHRGVLLTFDADFDNLPQVPRVAT